jgi:nucleoid DNA-binding protein
MAKRAGAKSSMGRAELADAVYELVEVTRKEAQQVVDDFVDEIMLGLKNDKRVTLMNFGHFIVHRTPSRPGRNPKTMEPVVIPVANMVKFKPAAALAKKVASKSRRRKPKGA